MSLQLLVQVHDPVHVARGGAADAVAHHAGPSLAAYHQGWAGVMRDGVSSTSAGYVDRVMDLHQQLEGHRSGAWA